LVLLFSGLGLITVDKVVEGDEHLWNLDGGVLVSELDCTKNLHKTEEIVKDGGQQKEADN
jgi:hypothetical protein